MSARQRVSSSSAGRVVAVACCQRLGATVDPVERSTAAALNDWRWIVRAVLVLLLLAPQSARGQHPLGVPPLALPDAPPQERAQRDEPLFRAAVTRVEVSALVFDRDGEPVQGLTAADFEIRENGVPQVVRSFARFTHEPNLFVLPDPLRRGSVAALETAPPPASNFYASASRIFVLVLDDLHVDARRTQAARAAARRLVEQLDATDLLLVTTTSSSWSTGYFTRDRTQVREMIDTFAGQRLPDRTIARLRFPARDFEPERFDHFQRLCATIRNVSWALRDVSGRRKTVILLTEGSSFGAGMSDMQVMQTTVPSGSSRVLNDALAAAAAANIAIYSLNPAGLDVADAELIQTPGQLTTALSAGAYADILLEARQAAEMARDFSVATGGVSLVDTNDARGGIDRAVRDASAHYVLSFEPDVPAKGSEYRRIEVTVRRPGVHVLARRGYRAPSTRPPPPMSTPTSLSPALRALLSGVMPGDGLPMRVQAVPLTRNRDTTTVAVIVEVNGPTLSNGRREGGLQIDHGLLTVHTSGRAANGTRRRVDVQLTPVQWDVLESTGLRSVWALELRSGRHQVRVAAIDTDTGRSGSVYLDVVVPSSAVQASSMLVSSRLLSVMPTVFVDERVGPWASPLPTTTRVFPAGDVLTVTVPHVGSAPATARLLGAADRVVWEGTGTVPPGFAAAQFTVPLPSDTSGVCDLVVETSNGRARTTVGILPPVDEDGGQE